MAEPLEQVFSALRDRLLRASVGMDVAVDQPGNVIVKTPWLEPGKKEPAWFGAVQFKKNYISYHLMPLYALPVLRETMPPGLEKRMQGKSCFNFKTIDLDLFDMLEAFTARCAAAYASPVSATPDRQ